jgi:hypothetical protein
MAKQQGDDNCDDEADKEQDGEDGDKQQEEEEDGMADYNNRLLNLIINRVAKCFYSVEGGVTAVVSKIVA